MILRFAPGLSVSGVEGWARRFGDGAWGTIDVRRSYARPSSTRASNAGQCLGCGTRVPARKREQAVSDRPVACAIALTQRGMLMRIVDRGTSRLEASLDWYSRDEHECSARLFYTVLTDVRTMLWRRAPIAVKRIR